MLFESLVNGPWFESKHVILFLNKTDLCGQKLKTSPVTNNWPDYHGDEKNLDEVADFFEHKFRNLVRKGEREIYVYRTNATDTNLVSKTMDTVMDMVINKNLRKLVY